MFEHLTLVSALLGGFVFTFLGAILSLNESKKMASPLIVIAALTATMFFLCTLGWSFFVNAAEASELSELSRIKHQYLTILFLIGIILFNVLLALTGWLRSKKVGIITLLIAVFALFSLVFLFKGSIS